MVTMNMNNNRITIINLISKKRRILKKCSRLIFLSSKSLINSYLGKRINVDLLIGKIKGLMSFLFLITLIYFKKIFIFYLLCIFMLCRNLFNLHNK